MRVRVASFLTSSRRPTLTYLSSLSRAKLQTKNCTFRGRLALDTRNETVGLRILIPSGVAAKLMTFKFSPSPDTGVKNLEATFKKRGWRLFVRGSGSLKNLFHLTSKEPSNYSMRAF